MHLKRLKIQGFKSFADKTEINFENGITCIVGPNGSGKSNVLDAIRWVLGEQSAKTLRGSRMEDIIFAGTKDRKPLGFGEVTIVFDNKDKAIPIEYSEVSITRRIFRSGESEYYINKNLCRLKDIKKLFMDTGVGKDGYSIIGQGRIDEILSIKPEERRNIFEEAAGILKYRSRKEETEKKLSRTEENLIRINDITSELKKQLKPLEEQSKRAKRYINLSEQLKTLEINVIVRKIKGLKDKLGKIKDERDKIKSRILNEVEKKDSTKKKYNELKTSIDKMDEDIEKTEDRKNKTQKRLDEEKNQLILLDEKEKYYKKEIKRLRLEIKRAENDSKKINTNIENLQSDYRKKIKEYDILNKTYASKCKKLQGLEKKVLEKEEEIENAKENVIEILNLITERKNKITNLDSFNENIQNRIKQIESEIEQNKFGKEDREEKLNRLENERNYKVEEVKKLNKALLSLKDERGKLQEKLTAANSKLNKSQGDLQGKLSNYNFLKNLEESYEGFYKSVKNVMKACENDNNLARGVVGVVADLIKVDKKYEKAISTALGSSLQNIVTETEYDAERVIKYLKEKRLGKVTFLPLTSIRGKRFNLKNLNKEEYNVIGIARDLVSYDKEYENIFNYLLGRTIVVKNLDWGIKTAKRLNYSSRIVTLDGDILNPGGSITGGSINAKNTGNILARKVKIKALKEEIKNLKNNQKVLSKKVKDMQEKLKEINDNITENESFLQTQDIELVKLENSIAGLNKEKERDEKDFKRFLKEEKKLDAEKEKIESEKTKLNREIIELELKKEGIQGHVKRMLERFEKEKANLNKLKDEVTDLKININSNKNNHKLVRERLEELGYRKESITEDIASKENELEENLSLIKELRGNIKATLSKKDKLKTQLDDISVELSKIKKERLTLVERYKLTHGKLEKINQGISKFEKEDNDLKIKATRYSVQLENYYEVLKKDYEISYREGLGFKDEGIDTNEAEKEIKSLENEIKSLGTINPNAVEEFDKVKKRFDFMEGQRNDLLEARESLISVIEEMEKKMEEKFVLSFKEIKENFKRVFAELFGGGRGDVYLEDANNPLSSGIKIIAQPPGKKPQNLSLLSGGEKALTAVALLFAILKTKPTPFCILDEIDAALDEANIDRYTNYLKEYADDTQFVIITHQKNTMEIADILYGVTMEEEGVSKVVSLKLEDKFTEVAG